MQANKIELERRAKGRDVQDGHRRQFFNKALAKEGFGEDALDLASDPMASCGHCGKDRISKLMICGKCGGAAYCSLHCQHKAWKKRKRECSRPLAQARKAFRELSLSTDVKVQAEVYTPRSTLPTKTGIFSETSSIGTTGIMWVPQGESLMWYMQGPMDPMESIQSSMPAGLDTALKFSRVTELPAIFRFLVSCGPLPDLQVAKNCVDETLVSVAGHLDSRRIKGAGFTALEWVAKKGNKETVQWLCGDPRTMGLVSIGSPVGWACYTGQVEIARELVRFGADPAATEGILWGGIAPLFVAGQNGQLEAIKFLVDEIGQDVNMVDQNGRGLLCTELEGT